MIQASALIAGQTIISTDRPGFDARNAYGTVSKVTATDEVDTMGLPLVLVTFTEEWTRPVYLRPFDRVTLTTAAHDIEAEIEAAEQAEDDRAWL